MFYRKAAFLIFLIIPILSVSSINSAEDPNAIVAKADNIRAPQGSYEFEATVTSYEGESKKAENGYRVSVKDLDHALVQFVSPASEKGKSLLMLGEDLWIYLPNVKKPVRIPFQQRLLGDVANGDMARLNFAHDYNATLTGEESVAGQDTWVLNLLAKTANKTYHQVKYWVAKSDYKPVQAEFFTVSGKSIKTCTYEEFRTLAGTTRPGSLVFRDSLNKNKKSILKFGSITKKQLNDSMFTKDYMKTLE